MPLSLSLARSLWNDSSRKDLIDSRSYIGDGFKRDCKCLSLSTFAPSTFDHLTFSIHATSRVQRSLSILVKLPPASLQTFTP